MESQPQNPEFRNNPEKFHPCTCIKTNSADPDEIPHHVAFHLGCDCLYKNTFQGFMYI